MENAFKARLARGETLIGSWLNMGSPVSAGIVARAGYDWLLIDGEHGPWDPAAIIAQLDVLAAAQAEAVLRVPVAEPWVIKQALDFGARSLIVPMVDSAEEARAVVAACRYPPDGIRGMGAMVARATGYGADGDYAARANGEICVVVQAESRDALAALEEIAAVDGVDGIFIGPADLSADMGYPGAPDAEPVRAAIADALGRIHASGKAAGIMCTDPGQIATWHACGARFFGAAADVALLREMASAHLASMRAALGN